MAEKTCAPDGKGHSGGHLMTVLGPVAADQVGVTLIHEHLIVDLRSRSSRLSSEGTIPEERPERVSLENLGVLLRDPFRLEDNVVLDDVPTIHSEVLAFKEAGGRTIVDCSNSDIGRSPSSLVQLAQLTGLNIVMGCGHFKRRFQRPELAQKSVEWIADEIISELELGVGGNGPKPGIIGEIGTIAPLDPAEKKILMAAARAREKTNVAMCVHVHPWGTEIPVGYEILRILEHEGVDLSRVILNHLCARLDTEYHEDLLRTGVNISYDHFGKEYHWDEYQWDDGYIQYATDLQRLEALRELISRGYINQLLISQDVCMKMELRRYGRWGYDHILTHIVPLAEKIGISGQEMETILVDNPMRVLTGCQTA